MAEIPIKFVSLGLNAATILFLIICISCIATEQTNTTSGTSYVDGSEVGNGDDSEKTTKVKWKELSEWGQFRAALGFAIFAMIASLVAQTLLILNLILTKTGKLHLPAPIVKIALIIPLVIVQFFAMFSGILCAFQSWFPCQSRTTTESGHEYESEYCSYWPKLAAAASFGVMASVLTMADILLTAIAEKF